MLITLTAVDQLQAMGTVHKRKLELQIGITGTFVGTIEVSIVRPGQAARTVKSYNAVTDPDDIITIVGPAEVFVGVSSGGSWTSGTAVVDVASVYL